MDPKTHHNQREKTDELDTRSQRANWLPRMESSFGSNRDASRGLEPARPFKEELLQVLSKHRAFHSALLLKRFFNGPFHF